MHELQEAEAGGLLQFQEKLVCKVSPKLAGATSIDLFQKYRKAKPNKQKTIATLRRLPCTISLHTQIIPRRTTVKIPLRRLGEET